MNKLHALLSRREARAATRSRLQREFGLPVIAFTLNIPGPDKDDPGYVPAHKSGEQALLELLSRENLNILRTNIVYGPCGREALFMIRGEALKLKELCIRLEESHPLGRLFDFDVYDTRGRTLRRDELHQPRRRCFLCDQPAFECARSRRHSPDEIRSYLDHLLLSYFGQDKKNDPTG
ncbi:MAG TPA: citrate lyase holo-[acyl-carrier protein] synthase [Sediminispirochaeta sp.]|nr:citrate lyase holo-[acyl-carrier protein] synthase [Sediminispirochaeta sp.]